MGPKGPEGYSVFEIEEVIVEEFVEAAQGVFCVLITKVTESVGFLGRGIKCIADFASKFWGNSEFHFCNR